MGLIVPSSGTLLSSRSYSLSDRYKELEGLCFLALRSTSVPLVMSHYAPPKNDCNWKEKRGRGGGCFSECFFSQKAMTPKKYTFSTLLVEFNYECYKYDFSCPFPLAMLHNFHYVCNAGSASNYELGLIVV